MVVLVEKYSLFSQTKQKMSSFLTRKQKEIIDWYYLHVCRYEECCLYCNAYVKHLGVAANGVQSLNALY